LSQELSGSSWLGGLLDRFRSLPQMLAGSPSGRVPLVQGLTPLECGAASLAMTLGYHGKNVTIEEVREVLDVRAGTSADAILRAAETFGLDGYGVRAEIEDIDALSPGTILHWEFNHFVVLDGQRRSRVRILDPAAGRRELSLEKFGKSFTGVALVFEPGPRFVETPTTQSHFRRYLFEILKDSSLWLRVLVASLLIQVLGLALPLLTGAVVQTIIPRADTQLALLVSVGLGGVVVSYFLAAVVRGFLLMYWRAHLDARLMPGLFSHLLNLPFEYFQQRRGAEIGFRLNSPAVLRDGLTTGLLSGLLDGTLVISYGAVALWMSPGMGVVVLGLALAQASTFLLSWRRQQLNSAEEISAADRMLASTQDIVNGIESLKGQGLERRVLRQWMRHFVDTENAHLRKVTLGVWVEASVSALRLASPLIVLVIGAFQVISGSMGLGAMLAFNAVAAGLFGPITNLVQTAQQLPVLGRHVERIEDVLRAAPESLGTPTQSRALAGDVRFEGVSYQYSRIAPFAVRDATFECKPGEFVAIVGPSGSGKSTLAKLAAGLYQPTSGRILYDELASEHIGLRNLRSQLGFVSQRPGFMAQSVRLNIANFDPSVSQARVEAAARAAAIHDEILQMPLGYEMLMLNEGGAISGGQRQRIALARALLGEPKILILDEATSALDALMEQRVFAHLEEARSTRIVIAHRLSTISRADRIVVMEAGKVVGVGTHEELMDVCALYRDLVRAQASAKSQV
jgi:ATP-binding cassette subfamily B protein